MTATKRIARTLERVRVQYDALIDLARDPDAPTLRDESVSAWSIGEQLEHLALADRPILDAVDRILAGGHADDAKKKPSKIGRMMLLSGWIPRGKGRAPEVARPRGADPGAIAAGLAIEKERCEAYDAAALREAAGTVAHFAFGHMTACQWLRFIEVHHDHHMKIIRDIQRAC